MRRFGETIVSGQRYTPRPGAYVILPRAGALLLTHQSAPKSEIQLPGGGIDPGESPIKALYREVLEETGWSIARPRRLGAYRRYAYMPEYDLWAEKICHVFVAHPVRALHPPTEPDHDPVWVAADLASSILASTGDAEFVARYVASSRR